jgi:hypothetical protein
MDAVSRDLLHRHDQDMPTGQPHHDMTIVAVKNVDASLTFAQFSVVAVTGIVFDPGTSAATLLSFYQGPVLQVDTPPTPAVPGQFVVLLQPLAPGAVGLACAAGVVQVQINMANASDQFADVVAEQSAYLGSGQAGAAKILWKQSGTGTVWAVVALAGAGGGKALLLGKPAATWTSGSTITLTPCDSAGVATGDPNVTVQAGWTLPTGANIPTSTIIPYELAADGKFYVIGTPTWVVTDVTYDATNHVFNKTYALIFAASSTSSTNYVITDMSNCQNP